MKRKLLGLVKIVCILGISSVPVAGQKGGQSGGQGGQQSGQGNQASQSSGPGGSQALPGLSYSPAEWLQLRLPDVKGPAPTFKDGRTVLCFRVAKANNSAQPFVLERLQQNEFKGSGFYRPCGHNRKGETDTEGKRRCQEKEAKSTNHWSACSSLRGPMLGGQVLVVGIDVSDLGEMGVNIDQLKLLNINVTDQQGVALNPSPIRASFPAPAAAGAGGGQAGSPGGMDDTLGKGNWWIPVGTQAPGGTNPREWEPNHFYLKGSVVTDSLNTHFYIANGDFTSGPKPADPFPPQPRVERIADGEVIWQEMNNPGKDVESQIWTAQWPYKKGAIVCVPRGASMVDDTQHLVRVPQRSYLVASLSRLTDIFTQFFQVTDVSASSASPATPSPCQEEVDRLEGQVPFYRQQAGVLKDLAAVLMKQNTTFSNEQAILLSQIANKLPDQEGAVALLHQAVALQNQIKAAALPVKLASAPIAQQVAALLQQAVALLEEGPSFQYYLAIKDGKSGFPPHDPLSIGMIPRAIYLTWPYQLPGDVIPAFTINMIYTPPVPGAPWQGNTFYPAGSVVTSTANNGHFYTALTGGTSSLEPKEPEFPVDVPPRIQDGDLVWADSGMAAPSVSAVGVANSGQGSAGGGGGQGNGSSSGGKPQKWLQQSHYLLGDIVADPKSGHYFTMVNSTGGTSGAKPTGNASDPFPQIAVQATLTDGELLWLQTDASRAAKLVQWNPLSYYSIDDTFQAANGLFYTVIGSTASQGTSGKAPSPFPPMPIPDKRLKDGDVYWIYSGKGAAAKQWQPSTPYSVGDPVLDDKNNVYVMIGTAKGQSGSSDPVTQNIPGLPATVSDGDLLWEDIGISTSSPGSDATWLPNHSYPLRKTVHSATNGHYYQVIRFTAGTSGLPPQSPFPSETAINQAYPLYLTSKDPYPTKVSDGTIIWIKTDGGASAEWMPNSKFVEGTTVFPRENPSQTWKAMNTGYSGPVPGEPFFSILQSSTIIEPQAIIQDYKVTWQDLGIIRPFGLPSGEPQRWQPGALYHPGDVIFVLGIGNGRYYSAQNLGNAGQYSPFLKVTPEFPITWQDSGTTAPAPVASGQPTDQNVSLMNLTLPQTHSLSYFNISAGVIAGFKRPTTFGFIPATSPSLKLPANLTPVNGPSTQMVSKLAIDPVTGCTIDPATTTTNATTNLTTTDAYYCPANTGIGSHTIDPVLVLTIYFPPVDAEIPWRVIQRGVEWRQRVRDLIPGFSFGVSLTSPSSNFYIGGSDEAFLRNVQVFYGLALQKVATGLGPPTSQPVWGGLGTAPAVTTVSGFQKGFFVGVTYNLSGFIQSLFGGGGSSKGQ
jgi:hypothetical protein